MSLLFEEGIEKIIAWYREQVEAQPSLVSNGRPVVQKDLQ